jgi:serine protease Do
MKAEKKQKKEIKTIKIPLKTLIFFITASILAGAFGGVISNTLFGPIIVNEVLSDSNQTAFIEKTKHIYEEDSQTIDAIEKVKPSVVSVIGLKDITFSKDGQYYYEPFNKDEKITGGTGFIITSDGLIITNKHVIEDPTLNYIVVLYDGTQYEAEIIDSDKMTDLAVLKLKQNEGEELESLQVVTFGDSDKLKVGQKVLAIGNALSEYENTVTSGIISAKGREVTASDTYGYFTETLSGLIQTDAAINPGNSGGPLINLNGEVIGINTAIAYDAAGIGFAIPVNLASPIVESIEENGKIIRPVIGVYYTMLTNEYAKENKLNIKNGAVIIGDKISNKSGIIPGGPADKAGLKSGDVILSVNNEDLTMEKTLQSAIYTYKPGDTLKLKVFRDDKTLDIEVVLMRSDEQLRSG